LFFVFLTADIL